MLILGIDPGLTRTGIGLISLNQRNEPELVHYEVIDSTAVSSTSSRLIFLYDRLSTVIETYQPTEAAMEKLFFQRNITTAMSVSEARGVATFCLAHHRLPLAEYTPNEVKQSVSGNGRADKKQVQLMVKMLLELGEIPQPDDAADALAVALCHASHLNLRRLME
jgi:crossover junction endodeoxyribonuclease RuvC